MTTSGYLGNCVTPERDVLESVVRDVHGDDVHETLYFMEDWVCKGEGLPVLHVRTTLLSNHGVDLLLHFHFGMRGDTNGVKYNKRSSRGVSKCSVSSAVHATATMCVKIIFQVSGFVTAVSGTHPGFWGTWSAHSAQTWEWSSWFQFLPGTDSAPLRPGCRGGTRLWERLFPKETKQELFGYRRQYNLLQDHDSGCSDAMEGAAHLAVYGAWCLQNRLLWQGMCAFASVNKYINESACLTCPR